MKVVVDLDVCLGHAQCEDAAPEVFRMNDQGLVDILIEEPDESLWAKVEDAARRCPADAITLVK
jgi:ferredoxin